MSSCTKLLLIFWLNIFLKLLFRKKKYWNYYYALANQYYNIKIMPIRKNTQKAFKQNFCHFFCGFVWISNEAWKLLLFFPKAKIHFFFHAQFSIIFFFSCEIPWNLQTRIFHMVWKLPPKVSFLCIFEISRQKLPFNFSNFWSENSNILQTQ